MGSKGIKAIIVDSSKKASAPVADTKAFKDAAKRFAKAVREAPFSGKALPAFGTAALMGPVNSLGAFPCYNATKGVFENWEKIGGEALAETIQPRGGKTKHMGCSECIILCSNEYVDTDGKYVTASLEYETLWAAGGMCGIDDLDSIARIDYLCDNIGVDTISTGVAFAILMDAGQMRFGDGEAVIRTLAEIPAYDPDNGIEIDLPGSPTVQDLLAYLKISESEGGVAITDGRILGVGNKLPEGKRISVFPVAEGG